MFELQDVAGIGGPEAAAAAEVWSEWYPPPTTTAGNASDRPRCQLLRCAANISGGYAVAFCPAGATTPWTTCFFAANTVARRFYERCRQQHAAALEQAATDVASPTRQKGGAQISSPLTPKTPAGQKARKAATVSSSAKKTRR